MYASLQYKLNKICNTGFPHIVFAYSLYTAFQFVSYLTLFIFTCLISNKTDEIELGLFAYTLL